MEPITYNVPCTHRMPCGWCEIKKEMCTYENPINLTPVTVSYKINPNWNEVTCSVIRSEDGET